MDYIAVVTFDDNSKTYEAASKLEGRDLGIVSAALVERDADGKVRIPESGDWDAGVATAGGSVIGLLIGVLGGPIGMLLGLTGGAAIGALVDIDRADSGDSIVERFAKLVPDGRNALVLQTDEDDFGPLDAAVAELGGSIARTPLSDVLDELEAQQQAADDAAAAARKALREEKHEDHKREWQERVDSLKAKFSRKDS